MGSGASAAFKMGQETAGKPTIGAGLAGVAQAAGNAAKGRASAALGLGEAASSGRQAAWSALNQNTTASSASADAGGGNTGRGETSAPAWARSLRTEQASRHRRQLAIHALQQGDRGGGSATPDIKERND